MPEPRPKVKASIQGVRMPMAAAMRRFWVTARVFRPKEVALRIRLRATKTASANTTIQSRPQVIERPKRSKAPDM